MSENAEQRRASAPTAVATAALVSVGEVEAAAVVLLTTQKSLSRVTFIISRTTSLRAVAVMNAHTEGSTSVAQS